MNTDTRQSPISASLPRSYKIYAAITHWVTISSALAALLTPVFILINPANNMLNPNVIFGAIFDGASPAELWALSKTGSFPGAHFYLSHIFYADSWAMLFMNLGCAVGFIALIPVLLYQLIKERDFFCASLGSLLAFLIFLSMTGILRIAG